MEVWTCKECGNKYLHAFLDNDGFSHSGRWLMMPISDEKLMRTIKAEQVLPIMASQEKIFAGGSYFDNSTGKWRLAGGIGDLLKYRE